MHRILLLLTALMTVACDSPSGPDDQWARPENINFAASLNIDLNQMNRTASGLYWQDLVTGSDSAAAIGQTVTVHYRGWFPDGVLFDSSHERGSPIEFPVGAGLVIAGLDEGVVGMQIGGVRKLVIKPELAYGRTGRGPIPPLTTLVFEVELVSIRR